MWQTLIPQALGSYNNMMSSRSQMRSTEKIGEINADLAKMKADQIRRNAKGRMAAAGDAAQEIQRQARVTESDAINAMAAGGTVTDPEMLARLKMRADANSVAAIMQGNREYYGLLSQASGVESGQRLDNTANNAQARVNYLGAKSNFLLDATDVGIKGYSKWKSNQKPDPAMHASVLR